MSTQGHFVGLHPSLDILVGLRAGGFARDLLSHYMFTSRYLRHQDERPPLSICVSMEESVDAQ